MSRLAIFDLDGTLVDSVDDLAASVNHALAALGLPPRRRDEIRGFVGEGARLLLARAVAPRDELLEPALALWREHYDAHCLDRTRLFPGVEAALAGAGRALAVHTNKPGALARKILAGLGVAGRFAAVVGGDEAPRKPDPAGTLELMARVGAAPSDTLFVGDSRIDAATARAAGVALVAVTWGLGSRAELAAAGATVFVDDAGELAAYLR
ncbi:HAD family hydrolase [Anaeromyxobacter sp. Fw109-5]|uniref:HAD family hydrolase n=1 Tax=Anaeromyxobacter sp. (strain Fw109-5) TaxID=404589 RepID=UPI0000ED805E|nr:HAD hydrolase-like protein [Anaeromyxobacter sp. Fw109-5]ABS25364.1 phosphoglycolate phosphatase [Anaeromyxobacter sp. Fw109-5]